MKKVLLYIRLNILYMLRNKARFWLTVGGITIGLFIYMLGNVAVDGYIDSLYKEAYNFDADSLIVYDEKDEIIDKIQELSVDNHICRCNIIDESYTINKDYVYKTTKIKNGVSLIGLDEGVMRSSVPYISNKYIALTKAKILYGRDFSDEDIKNGENCIIIEKSTALFWFQKENAVGEYVDVISPYGYDRFVVIGIIEDLPSTYGRNLEFNKVIGQNVDREYNNSSVAYTTYDYLNNMVENNSIEERYIVNIGTGNQNEDISTLIRELNEKSVRYGMNVSIVSRSTLVDDVRNLESKMRGFINAIIVVMIIIAGFMIITIYIFSVKERMYEIGVRRALGASEFDIVYQFIMEGIITALTAGVMTFLTGVVVCNLATSYLIGKLYMDIRIVLSRELIFSMFGLSVLQGIVFSFIPALIASKIRPTEAIRWD
ncbi:MAG: ABC transporter permease [Butyrivibrio sp.]